MNLYATVTTWTSVSASDSQGTFAITSKVTESVQSALNHIAAMHPDVEPVYVTGRAGWRWTWEGVSPTGVPWSDTVRIF